MRSDNITRSWYLIYSKPREEELASENLTRQGYTIYLPKIISSRRRRERYVDVIEPMFSRYLFIHLDTENDNWAPIRSTLGVSSIVRFGGSPAVVPDELIEYLKSNCNEAGLQRIEPRTFRRGDEIRIVDGVMSGLNGIFEKQTSHERAIVLLDIAGKYTQVSINRHNLQFA